MKVGDWDSARDAAEALYLLAPDHVLSLEKVMEARARVGRIASAEAAYAGSWSRCRGMPNRPLDSVS